MNSTKTPTSILKTKMKSMKSDGATPSSIESASYLRRATNGFHGTVAASIMLAISFASIHELHVIQTAYFLGLKLWDLIR